MSRFGHGLFENDITLDVLESFFTTYNESKDIKDKKELFDKLKNETLGFTKEVSEEMSSQILAFSVLLKNFNLLNEEYRSKVEEEIKNEEFYWDINNIEEIKKRDIFRISLISSLNEYLSKDKNALDGMTAEEKADEMLSSKYNKTREDLEKRIGVHKKIREFINSNRKFDSKEDFISYFK